MNREQSPRQRVGPKGPVQMMTLKLETKTRFTLESTNQK